VKAEAAVIVRMAKMYLDGAGWLKIAQILNRDGIASPGGSEWSRSQVWEVLHCSVYRDGVYTFGTSGGKGGKIPPVSYPHPEWKVGDDALWARVDAALVARTSDMRSKLNASKHTLSGVGRCAACRGGLSAQIDGKPGKKVTSYQCSNHRRGGKCKVRDRIRADLFERMVRAGLDSWFDAMRAAITLAVRKVETRIAGQTAPDVAGIERELASARAEQQRLVKLAVATGGDVEAVTDALKAGQVNVRRLEAAHVRATAPRSDTKLIAREIEAGAVQRLDALKKALHGPTARETLRAMFPQGLNLRAAPHAFDVSGDGEIVIDLLGLLTDGGERDADPNLTTVRNTDKIRIPVAT
ncbi:MAG: recombinase, partial [bacterium]|nr:recombinase [bacterium]